MKISKRKDFKTLLFTDEQFIVADFEDALQISIRKLETFIFKYGLKISTIKTKKKMAFKGRDPVRSKTAVNGNFIEQLNAFI
jgi:hypothetical protein